MNDEADEKRPEATAEARRRRALRRPRLGEDDSIGYRLATQWSQMRDVRRAEPVHVSTGQSNYNRGQVPFGVDLAAAWSWRFLVITGAGIVLALAISRLSEVVLPLIIALLLSALAIPVVELLTRIGLPRGVASILVVLSTLLLIGALLTFAGRQVANGAQDLADNAAAGVGEIKQWLKTGPLHASDSQINNYLDQAQEGIRGATKGGQLLGRVGEVGTTVSHVVAAFFIVLFSSYFFLADGRRIWAWLVRLTPRVARERVDSSGRVAWISLTQFVRATVIVAATDALGVMVAAWILQVPFVLAIGVLVFLGAFVPLIGAFVAGTVAVLVALVDQGPVTALLMLLGVVIVQQLEAHILQPFLMGRWVSVHPLAVIISIASGIIVAGIPGALVAVPLAAALNAVVLHLSAQSQPGEDPVDKLGEDYAAIGETPDPAPASGEPVA